MMKKMSFFIRLFGLIVFYLLFISILLSSCKNFTSDTKILKGYIVNTVTKEPLAATVSAKSGNGLSIKIDGAEEYVYYLGKMRWYVDGEFSLTTTEDSILLERECNTSCVLREMGRAHYNYIKSFNR